MKTEITITKEIDVRYLQVSAGVRYWEDATVNGVEDNDGTRIPFRDGDNWTPIINIDTGHILNWPKGIVADIHYKVCDDGTYGLLDEFQALLFERDGYVPDILCPHDNGYGDYIIMKVNCDGFIEDWEPSLDDFMEGDTE